MTIGVLGILLTIAFGIYSVWAYFESRKTVSLGFKKNGVFSLFKEDVNRLNIDIRYGGQSINNHLILFKGELQNNGSSDLDKSKIFKPVQIICSEKFRWLESNVIQYPKDASISLKILNSQILELGWDLLKSKEKIDFECLVETPIDLVTNNTVEDLYASLDFDFRITDLKKIKKLSENYPKKRTKKIMMFTGVSMAFLTFVMGLFLIFAIELPDSLRFLKNKKDFEYVLKKENTVMNARIEAYSDDILYVNDEKMNSAFFNQSYDVISIKTKPEESFLVARKIIGLIYFLLSIYSVIMTIKIFKKTKEA